MIGDGRWRDAIGCAGGICGGKSPEDAVREMRDKSTMEVYNKILDDARAFGGSEEHRKIVREITRQGEEIRAELRRLREIDPRKLDEPMTI